MPLSYPSFWSDPTPADAFKLSLVSVVVTLVSGIIGVEGFHLTGSSLILCYGLENFVDFFSSVVVLWRFFNPGTDPQRILILKKREKRASVAISFILGLLGVGIIVAAVHDFKVGKEEMTNARFIVIVSFISSLIFFTLTMIKLQMSTMLNSRALLKDGYCSLIGTVLALSLFLNTIIVIGLPSLWWLDPLISIICGIASLFLGLRSILIQSFEKKIPIFNPSWWIFSEGNLSADEIEITESSPEGVVSDPSVGSNVNSAPIIYEDLETPSSSTPPSGSFPPAIKEVDENNNDDDLGFTDVSVSTSTEPTAAPKASDTESTSDKEII